jgi:hypothetical protein
MRDIALKSMGEDTFSRLLKRLSRVRHPDVSGKARTKTTMQRASSRNVAPTA